MLVNVLLLVPRHASPVGREVLPQLQHEVIDEVINGPMLFLGDNVLTSRGCHSNLIDKTSIYTTHQACFCGLAGVLMTSSSLAM
jgi:hypothetical protein